MKTLVGIFIVVVSFTSVFGQNSIDPPALPRNFDDTTIFSRNFNHFILGWNWGGAAKKLDDALHNNCYHMYFWSSVHRNNPAYTDSNLFGKNTRRIIAPVTMNNQYLLGGRSDTGSIFNGQSILYDPTLDIDTGLYFKPRPYDRRGAVFGFRHKNKGIVLDSSQHTSADYDCFVLRKDSVVTPEIVLDSMWMNDQLRFYNFSTRTMSAGFNHTNGRLWYLTLNIKLKDTVPNSLLNDTIFTLKIPYQRVHIDTTANPDSYTYFDGTIRFDSIPAPDSTLNITGALGDYRGKYKTDVPINDTIIAITGAMLRHPSNRIDSILSLSAHFTCRGDTFPNGQYINNPRLDPDWFTNLYYDYITNLGLQITYHGKLDVGINWVRLETPRAREVFHGKFDREVLAVVDTIITTFQSSNTAGVKVHRFYGTDEMLVPEWGINRYYNMLLDTMAVIEMETKNAYRYFHATGYNEYWSGATLQIGASVAAPYIHRTQVNYMNGHISPGTFSIGSGYAGRYDSAFHSNPHWSNMDTLNSGYELRLAGTTTTFPFSDPQPYEDGSGNYTEGTQFAFEGRLYRKYYANPSMLYSGKPWLANMWMNSETWATSTTYFPSFHLSSPYWLGGINDEEKESRRPATGEETRYMLGSQMILGTKGLLHWFNVTLEHDTAKHWWWLGLHPHDTTMNSTPLQGKSYLREPGLGGDFIRPGNDPNPLFNTWQGTGNSGYLFNIMGIDSTRMYIGLRTVRMELAKTHTWITQNEDELMRLRLQAWYGKGFVKLYSQHPDYSSSEDILKKYVNYDSVKVRKLFLLDSGSVTANDTIYEHTDSTFYDITLHRDINRSMDSVFYIALDNRRTDPLIYFQDTSAAAWYMKFYPTDELDSLVTSADSAEFQELWWRRLGCRKITLPFDYKDADKHYALLKIKELGAHDSVLAALAPYRNNPYLYKTIDTVIGQDRGLDITLLPGEFKILKVEILRSNDVAGELAHSNQTKLTAHALMRRQNGTGPWIESDTIVQYMTYHKQIPGNDTGWTGVYFRKSKPANKKMTTAAPQWGEEYLLSDSLFHTARWNTHDTCAYPSIVTRFDSVKMEYRSHVVFACKVDTMFGKTYDQQYIFESVVRVFNDTIMVRGSTGKKEFGRVMDSVGSRNLQDWGTPMVNASDTANFYCWSDPDLGIIAGWKKPDSVPVPLVSQIEIHWTDLTNVDCHDFNAQHPSMNSYSRYIRGECESDCALVWQEKNDCTVALEHIFYTRLRIENGQIVHGLSPHYGSVPPIGGIFNTDSSIVCMSTMANVLDSAIASHTFPVVYREMFHADSNSADCNFDFWYPGHTPSDRRCDGVYWQYEKLITPDTNPIPIPLTNISGRWIWQRDTIISGSYIPDSLWLGWTAIIWSHQDQFVLDQPVVSAGEADYAPPPYSGNWIGCVNYSVRVMNLNFRSRPMTIYKPSWNHVIHDSLAEILHLPQTHRYPHDPYIPVSIVDKGYLSNAHLAERGSLYLNDWQRNHRIYNKRSGPEATLEPPPPIRTSGQYFFKTSGGQPIARQIHSFGDDLSSFGIATVVVREKEYPLVPKPPTIPFPIVVAPDTLSTNWFTVDYFEELRLVTAGNAPEKLTAFLERRSDGAVWEFTCTPGEQMKLSEDLMELYDGNNEEYRVRVCRTEYASYRPETAITSEDEVVNYKQNIKDSKSINLGSINTENAISIFPNPAKEQITIQLQKNLGKRVSIRILSALGNELAKSMVLNSNSWNISTGSFPAGMYYVVAQAEETGKLLGTTRFVIVK